MAFRALNLGGLFVGLTGSGGIPFVIAHIISITLEAIFCTSCVVMVYQLCLRWFGRERLEGLMTTAQVLIAVGAMLSGQILPRIHLEQMARFSEAAWWIVLLPPAWFAGIDDALAGSGAATSWLLAGFGLLATIVVVWIAFGKLAQNYATGLQTLNETVSRRSPKQAQRRWVKALVETPPLCWWLRDPIERSVVSAGGRVFAARSRCQAAPLSRNCADDDLAVLLHAAGGWEGPGRQ